MRPIKFRAWDQKKKKFVHFNDLKFGENGAYAIVYYDPERGDVVQELAFITLQRFTGLHDKNGKEIYEGDIFQCRSGNDKADMQGEIYFDEGRLQMKYGYQSPKGDQRRDYFLSSDIGKDGAERIEVIGNIYENPGLLK